MKFEQVLGAIYESRGATVLEQYLTEGGELDQIDTRPHLSGWTLLHFACEHHDIDMIKALIAAGADPNVPDREGWTALHVAVDSDIDGSLQTRTPQTLSATSLVLTAGGDPAAKNNGGDTAADIVARYRIPEVQERYRKLLPSR